MFWGWLLWVNGSIYKGDFKNLIGVFNFLCHVNPFGLILAFQKAVAEEFNNQDFKRNDRCSITFQYKCHI